MVYRTNAYVQPKGYQPSMLDRCSYNLVGHYNLFTNIANCFDDMVSFLRTRLGDVLTLSANQLHCELKDGNSRNETRSCAEQSPVLLQHPPSAQSKEE